MSQLTPADCWPRLFPLLAGAAVLRGSLRAEQPLFAKASAGEAVAQLWQAPQGLVVPGSYRQFTDLPAVSAHFAARGWPVWLRRSGGGLPRGRALSTLASPAGAAAARRSRRTDLSFAVRCAAAYPRALRRCQPPRAVSGSFCDGRYNLACGEGAEARKIVGTAQYWRPLAAGGGHVVLAHAVILVDADLSAAHQAANAFEAQLGSERVYCADKTVTSRSCFPASAICCPALARRWRRSWTRLAEGRFQVAAEGFHRARHARGIGPDDVQPIGKHLHRLPRRQQLLHQPTANGLPGAEIRQQRHPKPRQHRIT